MFRTKKISFKFAKMHILRGSSTITMPNNGRLPLEIGYRLISYIMELVSAHNSLCAIPAICALPEKSRNDSKPIWKCMRESSYGAKELFAKSTTQDSEQ